MLGQWTVPLPPFFFSSSSTAHPSPTKCKVVITSKVKNQHGQRTVFSLLNVGMLFIHGRQLEQDMFGNKGILWFRCWECQSQERHTESCNFCINVTYFATSDTMEREHQEGEKGQLSQHSRKRCFLRRRFWAAPHFQKGSLRLPGDLAQCI